MASSGPRRRSPRKRSPRPQNTGVSAPTGRAAYADTRKWLLKTHGHVCAYCGLTYTPRDLTLDHVTPRRGQSAYDRRDNLVLACKRCNAAKADKPFVAWVLGARSRAVHLYRYGQHLSEGILDLLRPMVGDEVIASVQATPPGSSPAQAHARPRAARHVFGPDDTDGESPYLDGPAPTRPAGHGPAGRPASGGRKRRRRRR